MHTCIIFSHIGSRVVCLSMRAEALSREPRYDPQAPELVAGRFKVRRFMSKYNTHFPEDATPESLVKDREEMLRGILGHVGTDSFVEPPVSFDYGCNIKIGDSFYSNFK